MKLQPFVKVLGVPWFYEKSPVPAMPPLVKPFSPEEDEQIRRLYPHMHTGELAEMMGTDRAPRSVIERARNLGVKKKTIVRKHKDGTVILMPVKPGLPKIKAEIKKPPKTPERKPWTNKELELLREHYPHMLNSELAEIVGHSAISVNQKAHTLGLKKTAETLRRARRTRYELADRP